MPLATFEPPVAPSPGTETAPTYKIKEASFGDGYSQSTREGLNHIREKASLTWEVLLPEQAKAIEDFFREQGGDTPFLYTLRDDVERQWKCTEHQRVRGSPNTMTATLVEDFSLVT